MPTFSEFDSLDGLVLREGFDIRLALLQSLVALYVQKPFHASHEERHFTELALRLIDHADGATRLAVARRLAAYAAAPAAVMQRLGCDRMPSAMASRRHAAAEHMSRPPSAVELTELFFTASADERRLILVNLAYAAPVGQSFIMPSSEAGRHLEAAALACEPDAFMRGLERSLGFTLALARKVVLDPLGEPIVVVAKVLGLAPDTLQRILLCLNPLIAGSVQLVYELSSLFDTIEVEAAHTLVSVWRLADPKPIQPLGFRSLHADAIGARRATSTPAIAPSRNRGKPAALTVSRRR
jgi:hypothetical protein